jgi:ankyrin repeat protein
MNASFAGRLQTAQFLLEHGADPTVRDDKGWTALTYAVAGEGVGPGRDYLGVLRLLLKDRRVPVDDGDVNGITPLWWACDKDRPERARVLLLEGADYTIRGYGVTPMGVAHWPNRGQGCVDVLQVTG